MRMSRLEYSLCKVKNTDSTESRAKNDQKSAWIYPRRSESDAHDLAARGCSNRTRPPRSTCDPAMLQANQCYKTGQNTRIKKGLKQKLFYRDEQNKVLPKKKGLNKCMNKFEKEVTKSYKLLNVAYNIKLTRTSCEKLCWYQRQHDQVRHFLPCSATVVQSRVASSLFGVCWLRYEVPHPVEGSEVETSTLWKRSELRNLTLSRSKEQSCCCMTGPHRRDRKAVTSKMVCNARDSTPG